MPSKLYVNEEQGDCRGMAREWKEIKGDSHEVMVSILKGVGHNIGVKYI